MKGNFRISIPDAAKNAALFVSRRCTLFSGVDYSAAADGSSGTEHNKVIMRWTVNSVNRTEFLEEKSSGSKLSV